MQDARIEAPDGHLLAATVVDVPSPRLAVVVGPAMAVPRGYYARFQRHLAKRGVASIAFDYRGIGGSAPAPDGVRMADWARLDLGAALSEARARWDTPLVLVGHSAGGQMAGLAPALPDAIVGVAAQSGWNGHWRGARRAWILFGIYGVLPGFSAALGRVPGRVAFGHDLPGGAAREWARWCRHPDYLFRDEGDARRAAYARFRGPLLALSFEDDDFGTPASVDAWARFFPNARAERRHVVEGRLGHWGFFRAGSEAAWDAVLAWAEDALSARPRAATGAPPPAPSP